MNLAEYYDEGCMKAASRSRPRSVNQPSLMSEAPSFYVYAKANPNPILVTDKEGTIKYVNAAWERLTGYASSEALGKSPHFLRSGKTPPELYEKLQDVLRQGRSFESEEFVDRKKDGSEFSIRTVFFPIQIHGKITYIVQELHDISARVGHDKQKDAFISVASHELRSPLAVIMLSLDLLKHGLGSVSDATTDILKTLRGETERMVLLLNDLLDVSRMQSGKLPARKEARDLEESMHRIVEELRTTYPTHALDIEKIGNAQLQALYDEGHIAQVLTNLISNAVKYSPKADRVVIRMEAEDDEAIVRVQDFGMGIGEEDQRKIFDMFYRAQNGRSIAGTGLGLFIAAQLIAEHDGRLWVTSKLGKGSTFHFALPLLKSSKKEALDNDS